MLRFSKGALLRWLLVAAFVLPLLAHAYIGHFSRYMADDYCTTVIGIQNGAFGGMLWWYTSWGGTFTNFTLKSALANLGTGVPAVLPVLLLTLWYTVLAWACWQIFARVLRVSRPLFVALLLAALLIYATMDGAPNVIQSFYWVGGTIPYTSPVIALTFGVGFFVRTLAASADGRVPPLAPVVMALVAFLGGGLSEVYVTFQIALLGLSIVVCLVAAPAHVKRAALTLLVAALIGGVAAMALIVGAPGNAVRAARFPDHAPPLTVLLRTMQVALSFIAGSAILFSPLELIVTLVTSSLVAAWLQPLGTLKGITRARIRVLLALTALGNYLLIMSCVFPAVYSMSVAPPARHYLVAQYLLVCTAALWGYLMGLGLRSASLQQRIAGAEAHIPVSTLAMIMALVAVGPVAATVLTLARAPEFRTWAAEWDARDQAIRLAVERGETRVEVPPLSVDIATLVGLEDIGTSMDSGHNRCAADYYGIESLVTMSRPAGSE